MTTSRIKLFFVTPLLACTIFAGTLAAVTPAGADPTGSPAQPPPLSIAFTPLYQLPASLNHGGKVDVTAMFLDLNYNLALRQDLGVGFHAEYDFIDYHFTGPVSLAGSTPWGGVHRVELGTNVSYDITPELSIYVIPSVQFSGESDADWGKSIGYGTVTSLTYDFTPKLTLGSGVAAFRDLKDTNVFPLLMVRWQITDTLLLANPLRPGPTGPAGLEICYTPTERWNVATGATYRSNRFRLGSGATVKGGIGEANSLPAFSRFTWKPAKAFNMDIYAGAMFGGALYVNDRDGNQISSDHYKPAPFASVAFSGHF